MTQLIFNTPQFRGQSFEVPEGKSTVGRAPGNSLIIEHDSVSGNHCEILLYGREVIVRDRASTNGTWVDGCRVKGQTAMNHGQRIRFGAVEAQLQLPPPAQYQDTEITAIHLHARAMRRPAPRQQPQTPTVIQPRSPDLPAKAA